MNQLNTAEKTIQFHPAANIFPMMAENEFIELTSDIEQKGLLEPIWLDKAGMIVDGRNRYLACCQLGIEPTFRTWDGVGSLTEFVVSLNLKRRHLTASQKACVALEIEQSLAIEAKERQRLAGAMYGRGQGKVVAIVPQAIEKSRDTAGKLVGISGRSVSDAKKLKNEYPQVFDSVASGKMTLSEGKREVKAEVVKANHEAFKEANGGQTKQEYWSEKLKGLPDHEKFEQMGIEFLAYDVWDLNKCDDTFGSDHPGRTPGQIVLHALAYYTSEGDVVVDPMAGSGTTLDACKVMGRKCYGYDIDMRHGRSDIIKHDIAKDGWPETIQEADLIFWDAPYFDKMDSKNIGSNGYIDGSISKLDRNNYLDFFRQSLTEARSKVKGGAKIAFLMSDYDDPTDHTQDILIADYWKIFEQTGWKVIKHIQVPLSKNVISNGDIVLKMRKNKQMARQNRYMLIAEPFDILLSRSPGVTPREMLDFIARLNSKNRHDLLECFSGEDFLCEIVVEGAKTEPHALAQSLATLKGKPRHELNNLVYEYRKENAEAKKRK